MADLTDRIAGLRSSLAFKAPAKVATTANITLSGEKTIDGVAVLEVGATGRPDRVLVKDQTNAVENGLYSVSTGTWSRTKDADGNDDLVEGTRIYVTDGTAGIGEYIVTTADPIIIDTTSITFTAFGGAFVTATGGTTPRSVADHFADTANVLDFGAIGNGVADDRTAFVSTYTRAVAADVPMIVPGGNYNFSSDYTPALTNLRLSISPDSEWNGTGKFKLDNLIPYQVTPVFARELIVGAYDSSFSSFVTVFQDASFAKANLATTAIVATFGQGEAAVASSVAWGGNFVGVASISGGTALGVEINSDVTASGGIAYGLVIASAGAFPSTAAIQIQSNTSGSKYANGIIFNNTTNNATTGALMLGNTGTAATGIDLSAMTFSTAEALFPSFVVGPTPGSINSQIRVDGGASNSAKLSAVGSNSNVILQLAAKGSSNIQLLSTLTPSANDGAALGVSGTAFSDAFLASGAVIDFAASDVTITHASNALAFAGATTNGYSFADGPLKPAANDGIALGVSGTAFSDLFLASGAVIDWAAGDVMLTHSANKLTWAGATSGYVFDTSVGAGGVTPAISGFEAGFTGDTQFRLVSNAAVDVRCVASNGNSIGTIGTFSNHAFQFVVNSAEKARVDATGMYILNGTGIPAGGTAATGYRLSSTANFGIFFGSGVPTLSAAKGSIYLRSDGAINARLYINTDGGTTWTAFNTAT